MTGLATMQDDTLDLPAETILSLEIPEGTSFERWQEIGRNLFARSKVINWWIGDWWAFGDHRYGERAKAAAEGLFGREYQTLANAASVAKAIEPSRRRESLSWSHHVEVAALPVEQADALLDKAAAEGLSVRDVRAAALVPKIMLGIARTPDAPDVDEEYAQTVMIARAWNRAEPQARQSFLDLANESNLGVIDP